jgi:RNA polymerase sigma factor for flagellar operon FliA
MSNELISDDQADYKSGDSSLESEARWFRQMTENLGVVYLTSQCGDSAEMNFESTCEGAVSIVANREIVEKLRDLIGKLPNDHARLIRAIYFEGATLQEAASRQGMSKSWASRLHAKILESLGKMLRQLGAGD